MGCAVGFPKAIHLHIGFHKTATTHLQRRLLAHRDELAAFGVSYYGPLQLRETAGSLMRLLDLHSAKAFRRREAVQAQVPLLADGADTLLLSEENFAGDLLDLDGFVKFPLYDRAASRVQRLAMALPEDVALRVFFSVRDPAAFLRSAYSQSVYSGRFHPPSSFATLNPVDMIDWADIASQLAELAPRVELIWWPYEEYDALYPTILQRMCGAPGASALPKDPRISHSGLSARAHAEIMARADEPGCNPLSIRNAFPIGEDMPRFELFDAKSRAVSKELYAMQIERMDTLMMERLQVAAAVGVNEAAGRA